MIHNQLLNNGIKFCQNDCDLKMDVNEADDIEYRWVPFCADIIDSVMCFGFAVVVMNKTHPSVMKMGTYWLKMGIKDNEYEFDVYEKGAADKPMKNVVVFNHFGYNPTQTGQIMSPMSRVLPRLQFLKNLRQTTITMEAQRSNPQYFSEIKDTGGNRSNNEGIDYDFYADANAAETSDDMKFKRNRAAIELFNAQKDLYESYLNPQHAAKSAAKLESITQLPAGQVLKSTASNTGRNDIVNIHKLLQEEVCAAFGVPRSMMFADGSGNRSHDTVGTHQTFMHTLLWWKRKLSVVLSDTYNSINADKITDSIDFKNNKDNLDELKAKYKVKVFFPVTPFVSNDELRKLYEQGVISWKSYGEYVLRNISLPLEDLQKKPPPVDELLFKKPEPKKVDKPVAEESAEETSKPEESEEKETGKKRKAEDKPDVEKEKKKDKKVKDK
tara:strand:- start:4080 stop:5402 length:1323 start_codon:yes stop_codon:yes gene_type:complete